MFFNIKRYCLYSLILILAVLLTSCGPNRKPLLPGKPDYAPLQQQVTQYLKQLPGTHTVYFKDLASGEEFGINDTTPIPVASCIKVPVVLYLYQQVAANKMSLNQRISYQASDFTSGAGALQLTAQVGNTFSLRCLSNLAITISDNIAYNMLVRSLGYDNVMAFLHSLAPDIANPDGTATATARDLGKIMEAVFRFSQEHPDQGRLLIMDLSHSIFDVGLSGQMPPELQVAHKEGSISGVVNDMGIIYGNRTYILTVMSHDTPDEDTGFRQIAAISRLVYDYQNKLPAAKLK